MKFSIRYKFAIGLLFIFCVSFNVMSFFMSKMVTENNKKIISGELLDAQIDLNIYLKQFLMINKVELNENAFEKQAVRIGEAISTKLNNRVILYKNDGTLLFDTDYSGGTIYLNEKKVLEDSYEELMVTSKGKSSYKIAKADNRYMVVFFQPLHTDNTTFGVLKYSKDYTDLFKSGSNLLIKMKLFMFFVFSMIFIFSILLSTRITIPISKLDKITREISKGNFDICAEIKTNDEIGELGKNFNLMKEKIKEQIETIKKDRDDLIKLEGHRKVFFDNVTHEMKTPLTIIDGYSQMILDEAGAKEQLLIKVASKIKKEAHRMHKMIIDILNMSKAQSNVDVNFKENINITEVINALCDDMKIRASKYEINIEKNLQQDVNIFSNKDEIRRMFINIIDNSIKYGNVKSSIDVSMYKESDECIIIVEDKGKGIDAKDLKKVFEPFYRANKSYSRKRGGNGLGLSIVRSIVQKHKGIINIESKVNEGTKVCVKIPLSLQVGNNLDNK